MKNGPTTEARPIERRRIRLLGVLAEHLAQPGRCRLALGSGAVTLLCATVAWGASEAQRGSVVIWSGDDQWVKIEPQDDPAALPNDHPAQLGVEAITSALGMLQVSLVDPDTGTESRRAVFTPDELGKLATDVASGLAQAGPRQDVTFSTIDGRTLAAGGLIRKPGVNAGRVFYDDGRLNVIFGELQSSYRKRNVYGQRGEDFTPRRQGSRREAAEQKWILAAAPGMEFHAANDGGIRNDWVMIDTAASRSEVSAARPSDDVAAGQAAPAPAAAASVPDASTAPATAAESVSRSRTPNADLEQRLRKLKELKDKGLISEEAYRSRMQEILSEL